MNSTSGAWLSAARRPDPNARTALPCASITETTCPATTAPAWDNQIARTLAGVLKNPVVT